MKYRKRPVVIDAWQWNGKTIGDARRFCEVINLPEWGIGNNGKTTGLAIPTLEGVMIASKGDYIIRGVAGEFYPCKPDIFEATYEKIEE